jgi:hypothetical protein
MIDHIKTINAKIDRLTKRKEKMKTQKAIHFMRETQKILQNDFTPELALGILSSIWGTASEAHKQNWRKNNLPSSTVKQNALTSDLPTTKDELIKAYEELCEEFLAEIGKYRL